MEIIEPFHHTLCLYHFTRKVWGNEIGRFNEMTIWNTKMFIRGNSCHYNSRQFTSLPKFTSVSGTWHSNDFWLLKTTVFHIVFCRATYGEFSSKQTSDESLSSLVVELKSLPLAPPGNKLSDALFNQNDISCMFQGQIHYGSQNHTQKRFPAQRPGYGKNKSITFSF